MKKYFVKISLVAGVFCFSNSLITAQSTVPSTEKAVAPSKKVDQPTDPNATLNGAPVERSPSESALKPSTQYRRINPADVKKMTPEQLNPSPVEATEKPAPFVSFGKNKPVNGSKTIESGPAMRPVHPKSASSAAPESPKN